jgi:REP element-mobilizing transposase RayT
MAQKINNIMPDLYKNKFRVKSARWDGYDYSQAGCYFVTICTKNREMFFGDVVDGKMVLSGIGEIAVKYWLEIPQHFNNTVLDEFIVMPNHVHGVVMIKSENHGRDVAMQRLYYAGDDNFRGKIVTVGKSENHGRDVAVQRLYAGDYPQMSKISPKPKSLSTIVRSFKSVVTKTVNQNFPQNNFVWQTRFYDRIVRNEFELNNVRNYILNNPLKCLPAIACGVRRLWAGDLDRNNMENLFM